MGDDERRVSPRVARAFMIRYQLSDARSSWLMSPLRDLSSTGARFISERAFATGEAIDAQLRLPTSRQPVSLKARVAWTKPIQWGMVELGVTFAFDDAHAKETVETMVTRFLERRAPSAGEKSG